MENRVNLNFGKVKTFRGILIEDLKKMDIREFAKYLSSRERRSVLRGFQELEAFIEKSKKDIEKNKIPKTQSRELVILPLFIGWTIAIHNGKEYMPVKIVEEMIGHRLGEFAMTRRQVKHGAAGIGSTKGSASASVK